MSSIFPGDLWAVGEARTNDKLVVVRFRTGLPSVPDREANANLIMISWAYTGNDLGMPNDEDKANMDRFEEALEQGFENSAVGVQVACITGNDLKEWRYYAPDTEAFLDMFNLCLTGHEIVYPIKLNVYEDPDWAGLSELQPEGSDQLH